MHLIWCLIVVYAAFNLFHGLASRSTHERPFRQEAYYKFGDDSNEAMTTSLTAFDFHELFKFKDFAFATEVTLKKKAHSISELFIEVQRRMSTLLPSLKIG